MCLKWYFFTTEKNMTSSHTNFAGYTLELVGFVCTLCACQETLWDRSLCKAWLTLKHGVVRNGYLGLIWQEFGWNSCMRKQWAFSLGRNWFWETLIRSFVFLSSLSWISEILIEVLKFTEHFALIIYPQNCGTKTDLECLSIVFTF